MRSQLALSGLALLLLAAACAPGGDAGAPPPATDGPAARPDGSPGTTPIGPAPPAPGTDLPAATSEPPAVGPSPGTTAEAPQDPWRTAELRDVRTGETVRVNDLAGRLVVIEPMAIWCVNCRIQQNEVCTALDRLDAGEIVYVSLDVDPNETESDLARYADEHDYPWHFVVASRDVARSLAQAFGDQVLSPPSTPTIIVSPDGSAEVGFGIKSADELEAELAAKLP